MNIARAVSVGVTAVAALLLAGNSTQTAPLSGATGFTVCADSGTTAALSGSQCVKVSEPLDYGSPQGEHVDLFIRKFPAAGRSQGQVWLIAGGPGESGASFYPLLATLRSAFAGYDLMIPDHRGTGFSTRLCPKEEARDSPGGSALEGDEWRTCFASMDSNLKRTRSFTITNAAYDLQRLMDMYADGPRVFLYGTSYGTQLVLRTLTVATPRRLDGVVLDGLVPPETTVVWDLSHRSDIADAVGRRVLTDCDAQAPCSALVGGSAEAALRSIEADPKLAALTPGGNPKMFFGTLLDDPTLRVRIPDIIGGLRKNDPAEAQSAATALKAFGEKFEQFPQSPPSIPLVSLISASENNARAALTTSQVEAEEAALLFASGIPRHLVGASDIYPRDAAFGRQPQRLPAVLVLQGDEDPKTPYDGALAHLRLLPDQPNIHLVTVSGGPHFVLLTAPGCFTRAVSSFVANGQPSFKTCREE